MITSISLLRAGGAVDRRLRRAQRLGRLPWQVIGQSEKRVLGHASDVLDPILRDTNARQVR